MEGQCDNDYLVVDLHLWSSTSRTSLGDRGRWPASPGHVLQEELQLPHAQLGIMCLGKVFNMQVQFNAPTMVFYYKKPTLRILGIQVNGLTVPSVRIFINILMFLFYLKCN